MYAGGEIKRFYKAVAAVEAAEGFAVALDGRPIRTPGRATLLLPNRGLARAIAEEWASQEERVRPQDMALMSLACTAIDIVSPRRADVVAEVADFGATDLICYRVERPEALVERQNEVWQPLLDWAALELDAPLKATSELLVQPQPAQALAALARAVEGHDDLALAGLATAVKASGSLVIGLALSAGRLDPAAAFEAAELHESHEIEAWGEDPEAARRRETVRRDLAAAARLFELLGG
ncbi:MAG: ATPase [Rhodospirillales bacterium]|nr:ATPase [Rhodospirillales bacterium]